MTADVAVAAGGAVVGDGLVAANGSAPAEDSVNADEAEPTDDLVAAKSLVLQRLGALVHLVGTLQYLPDSCVVDLIHWEKVTKGDDKLLPQREVEMSLITATPQVTAIKQNIWQQTAAAKVRSKIVG